jgi:hypothetical protein
MRGPIYPKIAAVLWLLSITGCAEGVDPGPIPEGSRTGRPTTTLSDNSDTIDQYHQIVTNRGDRNPEDAIEVYRDVAMFVYRDVHNSQILSQWLIDDNGQTYWTRLCRIGDKGGVLWNTCSSWDVGHDIADLGLPSFGPIAGMNTYTFMTKDELGHTQQMLQQTIFNERGDERMGRICPIVREPLWDQCTTWSKLAMTTEQMQVPGALSLRDDFYFSYTNLDGESVLVQNVLSIDGSLMWDRYCVTAKGGAPYVSANECGFGARSPLKEFDIRVSAIAGGAQYTYDSGGIPVLAQTFVSVDGTKAYSRSCNITLKGVAWSDCGPFQATSLAQLRVTQAPL